MSDIVERLRKGIEWTGPTQDDTGQTENLMDEAADEIERLRAEVEKLKAARDLLLEEAARVVRRMPSPSSEWMADELLRALGGPANQVPENISALKSGNDS